jgi:dihydroneopterin aldolase
MKNKLFDLLETMKNKLFDLLETMKNKLLDLFETRFKDLTLRRFKASVSKVSLSI